MAVAQLTFDRYRYPRLRPFTPVLSRGPRSLQVGVDQSPALVLADVVPGTERLLGLLDGAHPLHELRTWSLHLGLRALDFDWVLRNLDDAGLLSEGGRAPVSPDLGLRDRRIRLIGAGALGRSVAELLCRSGLAVLYIVDNDAPDPALYRLARPVGNQSAALAAALPDSSDTEVRVANHWTKPEELSPDLTILASDRAECDRVVTDGLVRADQPHLVVRARAGGAVVGPLVLPGRTACVRCTDLTRRDADPAWPTLLPQLMRISVPITAALIGWAGSVAVTQSLGFLNRSLAETSRGTIEISPEDYLTRFRSWPMHPGCGCGWGATAQWEA